MAGKRLRWIVRAALLITPAMPVSLEKRLYGKSSGTGNGAWRMRRGRRKALRETNIDALRAVGSCKCFVAGTQVKTPSGYRNIEDIRAGDKVLSYNEHTKRLEVQTVAQTFIRKTDRIYTLVYDTGTKLQTTATHPFYIEGKGWVKAADLHVGDDSLLAGEVSQLDVYGGARLQNVSYRQSKQGVIVGITVEDRAETVYNFEVNETHTYLVGESDVVVHNAGYTDFKKSDIEEIKNRESIVVDGVRLDRNVDDSDRVYFEGYNEDGSIRVKLFVDDENEEFVLHESSDGQYIVQKNADVSDGILSSEEEVAEYEGKRRYSTEKQTATSYDWAQTLSGNGAQSTELRVIDSNQVDQRVVEISTPDERRTGQVQALQQVAIDGFTNTLLGTEGLESVVISSANRPSIGAGDVHPSGRYIDVSVLNGVVMNNGTGGALQNLNRKTEEPAIVKSFYESFISHSDRQFLSPWTNRSGGETWEWGEADGRRRGAFKHKTDATHFNHIHIGY